MCPAKVFCIKNVAISLLVLVLCGFLLKTGHDNESKIVAASKEISEWNSQDWRKRSQIDSALTKMFREIDKAKNVRSTKLKKFNETRLAEAKVRSVNFYSETPDHQKISEIKANVDSSFMAYIKELDDSLLSNSRSRIPVWFVLGISSLFILLSSLRFALRQD